MGSLPPPLGGTTILFEYLYNALKSRDDVEVSFINIGGVRGQKLAGFWRFICLLYQLFNQVPSVDIVSLHITTSGLPVVGPFVLVVSKIFHKPLIVRKFGGTNYRDYGLLRKALSHWVLQMADSYFAETKRLVESAKEDGIKHVVWYPNNRPLPKEGTSFGHKKFCRRFVYMGHVRPLKGIKYIIDAAERFDKDVMVDIYGPFMEGLSRKTFVSCNHVHYKGILQPEKIQETLSCYDAMLMPTCFDTEGYPGSIIEAYFAGLPVICSRIGALPEIVNESCGIFVEPKNADSLYAAMKKLMDDEQLFISLCEGVKKQPEKFSAEFWNNHFVEHCRRLLMRDTF